MSTAIIPGDGGEFVRLSSTSKGSLFKKQILKVDDAFRHPVTGSTISVDEKFARTLVDNFKSHRAGIVQFPFVDAQNRHVEAPEYNRGEVVDLSYDKTGVYATIDVRRDADMIGSTVIGASAMMDLDFEDKRSGKRHGPTLLHVAATNRPYLNDLAPFEQVALSDNSDGENLVMLSRVDDLGEKMPTLNEMLASLKNDHGIDVEALRAQADGAAHTDKVVAALSDVLTAAAPNLVALSDSGAPTLESVAQGVVELSRNYADASVRLSEFAEEAATTQVDALVAEGRIIPAQRDTMLEIRLSDESLFDRLVPEQPLVTLSEQGVTSHATSSAAGSSSVEDEVARLTANLPGNSDS